MKRTKIVCTIGPASEKPEILEELIKSGMNVMRLNFSHGDYEEHLAKIKTLQELNKKLDANVAFMLDTRGPEIRTGVFADGKPHEFLKGNSIVITTRDVDCDDNTISVTYKGLPNDIEVGSHILIDDGLIDVIIDKIEGTEMFGTIQNSGTLKGKRGVNVPGAKLQLKALTEKDISDITFGVQNGCNFIAASFIRKAEDVLEIRKLLNSIGGENVKIISKIENQEGLDNFDSILEVTDGIMVARGDLGVEIPIEKLPSVQKMMIKKTVAAGKPVITATQMLESMQKNPRPTRAEVSDVANAVYDGTSAVMLSGESAQGEYPKEAVKVMASTVKDAEEHIDFWKRFKKRNIEKLTTFTQAENLTDEKAFKMQANFAVCCSAMFANADAIIAVSEKGVTPSMLSSYKPACPVFVITANENTFKQMAVENGVRAILVPGEHDFDKILNKGIELLKERKWLFDGDTVVLSGGFPAVQNKNYLANSATGSIIKI